MFLSFSLFTQSYCELFSIECSDAKVFYQNHKSEFDNSSSGTNLTGKFLFSIVAPEITQYNWLKDKAESMALKVLYVQQGNSYADFSIGNFQMKPSFIESMEKFVQKDAVKLSEFLPLIIKENDIKQARILRLKRMEQLEWQLTYLKLFVKIVAIQFSNKTFNNENEKLKFYASAYNCGFLKSESIIERTSEKKYFPFFSLYKFKYKEIAEWFFIES